jgi:hypothetical protein
MSGPIWVDPDVIGIGPRGHRIRHSQLVEAARRPRIGWLARKIRRLLIIAGKPLMTRALVRMTHSEPIKHWMYERVRQAASKFAEIVSRGRGGFLWALKQPKIRLAN